MPVYRSVREKKTSLGFVLVCALVNPQTMEGSVIHQNHEHLIMAGVFNMCSVVNGQIDALDVLFYQALEGTFPY